MQEQIMYILQALLFGLIIPFVMILVGYILKLHPQTDMRKQNGYCTPAAKKSQARWDYAQRIAPEFYVRLGAVLGAIEILLNPALILFGTSFETALYIGIGTGFVFLIMSFFIVDSKIEKKFENE